MVQKIPFRFFRYLAWPAIAVSTIFLALTVFTPFGVTVLGARRWLNLPLLPSFQPSEFAKAALILFLAFWFSEEKHKKYIGWYYLVPVLVICLTLCLIMLQRAFTTSVIVFIIAFMMLIVCGIKFRYMFIAGCFIAVPAISIMFCQSYRIKRVFSFLFPDVDTAGVNWQVSNSLKAIGSGGVFGKGMGNGEYKRILPEIENDFIFANIGEEQGLMGMFFIIGLFALFAVLGLRAYERAEKYDHFSAYLAFGITSLISVQTVINLSVVLGLMPPTGIPLPFFSQGGTNLLIILSLSALLYKSMKENTKNHGKE
jgi:Bacterial cell division membrane protein